MGLATRYAVEAKAGGNPVGVSPSVLEAERKSPLYTALVQVAPEGRGREVCFTVNYPIAKARGLRLARRRGLAR